MKQLKYISFFFLTSLLLFSCSEKGLTPTQPEIDSNTDKNVKSGTSSSQPRVRYDDLDDHSEFVVEGRRWFDDNLTYFFSNGTADISGNQEQQSVEDAFDLWADNSPLTFTEVNYESQADIVILWATGAHGDGNPFDGVSGVLAHVFFPPPNNGSLAGDAHFDDAETWTLSERSNSSQPIDLTTVVAHEIGHSLGLGHSQVQVALMFPFYSGSHRFLAQDDIDGIQEIYPLNVGIYGPVFANSGQTLHYSAEVKFADDAVNYQWYYRATANGQWYADGNNESTYQTSFYDPPGGGVTEAGVKVEVSSAGETATSAQLVSVLNSGGCQSFTQNKNAVSSDSLGTSTDFLIPC